MAINVLVYWALSNPANSGLVDFLVLNKKNPQGIITSVFTHYWDPIDLDSHIISNLEGFLGLAIFFIVLCPAKSDMARNRWGRRFILMGLGAAFGANGIEYVKSMFVSLPSSHGFSGVLFGSFGILVAELLLNAPNNFRESKSILLSREEFRKRYPSYRELARFILAIGSIFVLAVFLIYIVGNSASFFGTNDPTQDSFAHELAFAIGLAGFALLFRKG